MPTPKYVRSYTAEELSFIERGYREGLRIQCPSYEVAAKIRMRLYGLQKALRLEEHPTRFFGDRITMLLPRGSTTLTILRTDDQQSGAIRVEPIQPRAPHIEPPRELMAEPPAAEVQAPNALQSAEDPMESALRKLGFFTQGDKSK